MKKMVLISGIITILFLSLFLTGWADADSRTQKALRQGNQQYGLAEYEEALESYETGIAESPENLALNFNAAQTAYLLGEYEKAVQYYEKSEDSTNKFLNGGNASFRLGEAASDPSQKMQYYTLALQTYQEGIIKYPQDVLLKYNYELVKQKLEELLENMEQENDGQNEDGGDSDDSQENQESQESQENQNQSSQNQDESGDRQSQDQEAQDQEAQDENTEDDQEGSYSQEEGEYNPDQEDIERILEMLENQEEESLKNNQGVVGGKDERNGW